MTDHQHVAPALRIFDGTACLARLERELGRLSCRRAVIFCGRTLARDGSALELVKAAAGDKLAGVFDGVMAHSPLPAVEAGAERLRDLQADAAIAVGGGSAIVTARAASILVAEERNIRELCTSRDPAGKLFSPKLMAPKLPQLIIPTTPTTAMAKAGTAVLDPASKSRLALFDPKTRAGSIFLQPDLLGSAPVSLFVDAGLNTFCSAVEGLMSERGDPLSDALLMQAVRLYSTHLREHARLDVSEVRKDLAYAAIMAGRGTDHTAGGITTALGHAVAAHCGVEAGQVKLVLLPHAMTFNAEAARAGLRKLSEALAVETAHDAIATLPAALGLAGRLRDAGVERGALGAIAEKAMADWFLRGNPRPVRSEAELLEVLEAAW